MPMFLSDALDALLQFQQALDTSRSSGWVVSSPSGSGSYPPLNVFRQDDDIVVIAEVPGVRKSDLQIEVQGRTIRIAGTKSVSYGEKSRRHRRERLAGRFDRAITLPVEVDAEKVKAECRDGILALHLPRAERDHPKTIELG